MERITERLPLLAVIVPQTVANSEKVSAYVDATQYEELLAELQLADMASETIDFRIQQATDNSGTGAKVLKASTQLAASATGNDSKQLRIQAYTVNMDSANGFKFVAIRAITGGATGGLASATLHGIPRYRPGTSVATVLETATL